MLMIPMAIMMISNEEDRDFIKRLFLENEVAMFIAANNVVRDYHIARDMVSEACVVMINKIEYLRKIDEDKRTSYIIAIARNNALMYLRKQKREMNFFAEGKYMLDAEINAAQEQVDSMLIAEADMQTVRETLSKIHKKDSDLLRMKYFENVSDAEIAQRIGIGAASVRFYLTKAKRNFANELKRSEEE